MTFTDLIVPILSHPDATPKPCIEAAISVTKAFCPGAELTGLIVETQYPAMHNPLANALISLDTMAKAEESVSHSRAKLLEKRFVEAASNAEVLVHVETTRAPISGQADLIAETALTHDMCLIPVGPSMASDEWIAETVLFGSGRPILIFPELSDLTIFGAKRAAVAWDGSIRAARALADALPILSMMEEVRILVVLDEKPTVTSGRAGDLVRHLRTHGIEAVAHERRADGRHISTVIDDYVASENIDLLVMGGYGHSRLKEFVLGGATSGVLRSPPCATLLSH